MPNERITIYVEADGMSAWARVIAGAPAGATELESALQRAAVSFGVNDELLRVVAVQLADPHFAHARIELAAGTNALPGRDGWFEPAFEPGLQAGHLRQDGSMDFFDRELLKPVASDTALGWLHPANVGTPGRDVRGEVIKVPAVRDLALRLGAGVRADADALTLRAARAGVVVYLPSKSLDVVDHHVHVGDVDLKSGHLEMQGSLSVRGDVHRHFQVRATGDLVVQGSVDGSLFANGNIAVQGAVHTEQSGVIVAGGELRAHNAERSTLRSGGRLLLDTAIHCELSAERIVVARGLRGGLAAAELSIVAAEVGSPHGSAVAELAVAVPLDDALFEAKRSLDLAKARSALLHQAAAITRRDSQHPKGGKAGRSVMSLQRQELERKVVRAQRRQALLPLACIEVSGVGHAGVVVSIGPCRTVLEHDVTAVRFSYDSDNRCIRQEGLGP